MNFSKIFLFVFACFVLLSTTSAAPEPRWKVFKKIVSLNIILQSDWFSSWTIRYYNNAHALFKTLSCLFQYKLDSFGTQIHRRHVNCLFVISFYALTTQPIITTLHKWFQGYKKVFGNLLSRKFAISNRFDLWPQAITSF